MVPSCGWLVLLGVNGELEGMSGRSPCDFSSVTILVVRLLSPPFTVCVLCVCACKHTWRLQVEARCLPLFLSILVFELDSLIDQERTTLMVWVG